MIPEKNIVEIGKNIGLIHVFEVVNIRRGPKNGLTPECEAQGCKPF